MCSCLNTPPHTHTPTPPPLPQVVTLNYRLGLLGFLYTGSSFVGNFGIMDQELALRWVQVQDACVVRVITTRSISLLALYSRPTSPPSGEILLESSLSVRVQVRSNSTWAGVRNRGA